MNYLQKLETLNRFRSPGNPAERICSELTYLDGVSRNEENRYDARIEAAADALLAAADREGTVTMTAVREAENMLADLVPAAKRYTELFLSHAHIDMNWMWGYQETAAVTVDTFRTVLGLMRDYPDMTFGQSQASTYEIIEKFCPELLPEIRQRVREGRWEVNAAEWVEPDKNMPDGESLTRQILQSRKYLSRLLGIDPADLNIDFVPDTFGHNRNVPEILADAGVRYMYHCRGYEGPCLYYYVSPSGKKTLNYCEYAWYNGEITPQKFELVPTFCRREKVDTYLCVFGVGDHGGGPSRRDVERIEAYRSWPLTPTIRFGTMREFFAAVEKSGTVFSERRAEMNCLFTGCYTTQSRIKMSNRISEARINETEALSAFASLLADAPREPERLDTPWRNLLFNHFHDILPGSGTIETREYAMGRFQETLAAVNTYGALSMRRIAAAVNTAEIPFAPQTETVSEGGGVGFAVGEPDGFRFPAAERGRGPVRAFHLFNTTGIPRDESTEITVWDYSDDLGRAVMTDADGNEIPFCVLRSGNGYWGHHFAALLVKAKLPAFGYTTVILKQRILDGHIPVEPHSYEKSDEFIHDGPIAMESDKIRAVFDRKTMRLTSLTDKETGGILIDTPSCYFRYADENPIYHMTSWRVGPYMKVTDLNAASDVRFTEITSNELFSRVKYEMVFGNSKIRCQVELKRDSAVLEFGAAVDWNEAAVPGEKVPQISFAVPVSYRADKSLCDIPFGTIERAAVAHDVPALSFLAAAGESPRAVAVMTDSKYGYRLWDNTASVTLIRSAYDPDPYPERGIHHIRIGVAVGSLSGIKDQATLFNHPISFLSAEPHDGSLPLTGAALTAESGARVTCVKNSEDGQGTTVRLCEETGADTTALLRFCRPVSEAWITDSNETPLEPAELEDGAVTVPIPACSVVTVTVRFAK